jgi:hypothetical protein
VGLTKHVGRQRGGASGFGRRRLGEAAPRFGVNGMRAGSHHGVGRVAPAAPNFAVTGGSPIAGVGQEVEGVSGDLVRLGKRREMGGGDEGHGTRQHQF